MRTDMWSRSLLWMIGLLCIALCCGCSTRSNDLSIDDDDGLNDMVLVGKLRATGLYREIDNGELRAVQLAHQAGRRKVIYHVPAYDRRRVWSTPPGMPVDEDHRIPVVIDRVDFWKRTGVWLPEQRIFTPDERVEQETARLLQRVASVLEGTLADLSRIVSPYEYQRLANSIKQLLSASRSLTNHASMSPEERAKNIDHAAEAYYEIIDVLSSMPSALDVQSLREMSQDMKEALRLMLVLAEEDSHRVPIVSYYYTHSSRMDRANFEAKAIGDHWNNLYSNGLLGFVDWMASDDHGKIIGVSRMNALRAIVKKMQQNIARVQQYAKVGDVARLSAATRRLAAFVRSLDENDVWFLLENASNKIAWKKNIDSVDIAVHKQIMSHYRTAVNALEKTVDELVKEMLRDHSIPVIVYE